MKKAPKINRKKFAEGGETTYDDPKKPLSQKMTADAWHKLNMEHGNAEYPSAPGAQGHKQYYDKSQYTVTKGADGNIYSTPINPSNTKPIDIYSYEYQAPAKVKTPASPSPVYGNYDPVNKKQIPYQPIPQNKAKGGEVKKMTKCPMMKKGGKC